MSYVDGSPQEFTDRQLIDELNKRRPRCEVCRIPMGVSSFWFVCSSCNLTKDFAESL